MATALDLIKIAGHEADLKITEYPPESNIVKYNTWYYGREVRGSAYPWCVVFLAWCFNEAGALNTAFPKMAGCSSVETWYRNRGQSPLRFEDVQPGDILVFSRGHIGIAAGYPSGGAVATIEGNTSYTSTGSQANGGAVARRIRAGSEFRSIWRPYYDGVSTYHGFNNANKFKLCNLLIKTDKLYGQPAIGATSDKGLRVRYYDAQFDIIRQIKWVVKTDDLGNPMWLSRRLIPVNQESYTSRIVLAGRYRCVGTHVTIHDTKEFKVDIHTNFYRPDKYMGNINIISSTGTDSGWQLFVNKDNNLEFLVRQNRDIVASKVFDTVRLDTSTAIVKEAGDYFNAETGEFEWKNVDGTPKEGKPKEYLVGARDYHIAITKDASSSDFLLQVDNSTIPFNLNLSRLYTPIRNDALYVGDTINYKGKNIMVAFTTGIINVIGASSVSASAKTRFFINCDYATKPEGGTTWEVTSLVNDRLILRGSGVHDAFPQPNLAWHT